MTPAEKAVAAWIGGLVALTAAWFIAVSIGERSRRR